MNKIINPRSVAILMATYNGEKYLGEQIESILKQTNREWTLYIQDDGSRDGTTECIRRYEDNDRVIWVDRGLNRQGCCMNFMSLLNMVESSYYMFCDQDDVWLPTKVEISLARVRELERQHPELPILVHTDKKHVDEHLRVTLDSELNRKHEPIEKLKRLMKERNSLEQLRLGTFIAGCVMCFNHKTKEVSFPFNNSRFQDSVVAMAVAANRGVIDTIFEPTMLYRIHSTNTCGVSETSIKSKLYHLAQTWNGQKQMYYLYKIYGGGGLLTFIKLRIRRFLIRGF
jgi:rhamnosyltransferase